MSDDNPCGPSLQPWDATNGDEPLYTGKSPSKQFEMDDFSDEDDAPNFDLLGSDDDDKQHENTIDVHLIKQEPDLPRAMSSFQPPRPLLAQPAAPLPLKPAPISGNPFARPIKEISHIKLPGTDVKIIKKEDRQTTALLDSFLGQTAAATNQQLQANNGQRKRKIVQILWSDDDEEEDKEKDVKEEENQLEQQQQQQPQRQDDDVIDLTFQQNISRNTVPNNYNNNNYYPSHPAYLQKQQYCQNQQYQQPTTSNNTSNSSNQYWWMRFADFVPVNCLKNGINPRHGGTVYIDYKNQFSGKLGSSVGGASAAARAVIRTENADARHNNNNNYNARSRSRDYDCDYDDDGGDEDGGGGRRGRRDSKDGNGGYWQQEGGSNVYIQADGRKLYGQLGYRAYLRERGKSGGSGSERGGGGGSKKKKGGGGGRGRSKR